MEMMDRGGRERKPILLCFAESSRLLEGSESYMCKSHGLTVVAGCLRGNSGALPGVDQWS
jgi:hypothetical protein